MFFKYSSKGQVSSCINEENVKINFDSVSRGIQYQQAKKTKKTCDWTSTSGSALGAVCSFEVVAVPLVSTREGLSLALPGHCISVISSCSTSLPPLKQINSWGSLGSYHRPTCPPACRRDLSSAPLETGTLVSQQNLEHTNTHKHAKQTEPLCFNKSFDCATHLEFI